LLIGTGKSIVNYKNNIIIQAVNDDTVTISINHIEKKIPTDFVFISNNKRLEAINGFGENHNIICTSNVEYAEKQVSHVIDYSKWVYRKGGRTSDNPLLIMINLLINIGVSKVYLAGFDGFTADSANNYLDEGMQTFLSQSKVNDINELLSEAILYCSKLIDISFITPSLYEQREVLEEVW
jgi:4-hydroxy 2-oxovalerate aldolase